MQLHLYLILSARLLSNVFERLLGCEKSLKPSFFPPFAKKKKKKRLDCLVFSFSASYELRSQGSVPAGAVSGCKNTLLFLPNFAISESIWYRGIHIRVINTPRAPFCFGEQFHPCVLYGFQEQRVTEHS